MQDINKLVFYRNTILPNQLTKRTRFTLDGNFLSFKSTTKSKYVQFS